MAHPRRDRLSFAAVLLGGVCVVAIAGVLVAVLRTPAVPRPRGLITVIEPVAPSAPSPQLADRDDARVPTAGDQASAAAPPQTRFTAVPPPPAAGDNTMPSPAVAVPAPPVNTAPANTVANAGNGAPPAEAAKQNRGLVILQIGDSHTAADYFSGEVRAKLQARYGSGGTGYIDAGKPTIGVRSGTMRISASPGWTYHAIQRSENVGEFWLSGFNAVASASGEVLTFTSENVGEFWLSGFNAVASASGEVLTFTSETPVPFDAIEVEALRQPGGGAIDISLDGTVKSSADLGGQAIEPVVLRLRPDGVPTDRVRQLEIRTRGQGTVSIASIGIYQKQSGVSYNNVGYPGATIDLLNKFDAKLMADDLRRLDPQIVVLVFGTNEASKPNLDAARYERSYEKAVGRITAALPNAKIVLVGPPDGAERPWHCGGRGPAEAACHPAPPSGPGASTAEPADCEWHTIAHLDVVRDVEKRIAERHGFTYWNWASIMPGDCASQSWVSASPPLMTPDHVHFTPSGYVKGADLFLQQALIPVIEKLQVRPNIAANN